MALATRARIIFAFVHATIVKDPQTTLQDATLVIKQGKIVSVGTGIAAPKDAVVIDCRGKYIYPSFIDLFTNYGITAPPQNGGHSGNPFAIQQETNTKGAYGWNQAIKPELNGRDLFTVSNSKAKDFRNAGFGTVVAHNEDGIARGNGTLVTLGDNKENLVMLKDKAAAFYSFEPGSSTQEYPNSLMGVIALLRQTYLDGEMVQKNNLLRKAPT